MAAQDHNKGAALRDEAQAILDSTKGLRAKLTRDAYKAEVRALAKLGYKVVPVAPVGSIVRQKTGEQVLGGKIPAFVEDGKFRSASVAMAANADNNRGLALRAAEEESLPTCNLGIIAGVEYDGRYIAWLDFDLVGNDVQIEKEVAGIRNVLGIAGAPYRRSRKGGACLILTDLAKGGNFNKSGGGTIQLLERNLQAVVPPSIHPAATDETGPLYLWEGGKRPPHVSKLPFVDHSTIANKLGELGYFRSAGDNVKEVAEGSVAQAIKAAEDFGAFASDGADVDPVGEGLPAEARELFNELRVQSSDFQNMLADRSAAQSTLNKLNEKVRDQSVSGELFSTCIALKMFKPQISDNVGIALAAFLFPEDSHQWSGGWKRQITRAWLRSPAVHVSSNGLAFVRDGADDEDEDERSAFGEMSDEELDDNLLDDQQTAEGKRREKLRRRLKTMGIYWKEGRRMELERTEDHNLDADIRQLYEACLLSGIRLYRRENMDGVWAVEENEGEDYVAPRLVKKNYRALRAQLQGKVVFVSRNGKKLARSGVTEMHTQTLLAYGEELKMPFIASVVSHGLVRVDGSVIYGPGHDSTSQAYMTKTARRPSVFIEKPTLQDARKALEHIEGLLCDFPFVGNVDKAVALSGIMTPVMRHLFDAALMHGITATTPGTGKSYLVDLIAAISLGTRAPTQTTGDSPSEFDKRLVASMRGGQTVVAIDNVSSALNSDTLCQITERPRVAPRNLGESRNENIRNRFVVYATGNNLQIEGDMTRRTIICRLDAEMERPELRSFRTSPVDVVLENRMFYVEQVILIARAFLGALARQEASTPKRVGSYEKWSDYVRGALLWLGYADPAQSFDTVRANDQSKISFAAGLSILRSMFGARKFTAVDVIDRIKDEKSAGAANRKDAEALETILAGEASPTARSLGHAFTRQAGVIQRGMVLRSCGVNRTGSKLYQVEFAGGYGAANDDDDDPMLALPPPKVKAQP